MTRPRALILALTTLLTACSLPEAPVNLASGPTSSADIVATPTTGQTTPVAAPARTGTALAALSRLRVAGRGPMTGYARAQFGPAWTDTDRNGCDTRNDVLRRDLTSVTIKPATSGCVVAAGTLHDPYSGRPIAFVRGPGTSTTVQIDHVVALGDAWETGAARWPYAKSVAFANDPLNLLAVAGAVNQQKGDGDAATWLPPNRAYRCRYVALQVSVKTKYQLAVTPAERAAIQRVLGTCSTEPAPFGGNPTLSPVTPGSPGPSPAGLGAGGSADYANCAAARAAGVAPIHRGEPGYRTALDGDGDGSACE